MVLLMKSAILTGAFLSIVRSHALSQSLSHPPRHIKNGTRIAAWTMKSVEVLGLSCTAISEWIHPQAHSLGCNNVFTDSNDAPAPDDESHVWAADNEGAPTKLGSCVGIWIELEMPEALTVDVVAYRQRYYPADQGDEMDVTMKSSDGTVLSTQGIKFTSVNQPNPHEEAFSLTPTAGVKYIRFTYTKADTADCSNTGGYLGAKRIKVYSAAPVPTPAPTPVPSPWPSDATCINGWIQGDGAGGSETYLGVAADCDACIQMVLNSDPNAAAATFRTPGLTTRVGQCYIEHGWTNSNGSPSWITIPFNTPGPTPSPTATPPTPSPTPLPTAAAPAGYTIAYSDTWCGDTSLYDATFGSSDAMLHTTVDSCAQKCNNDVACQFFVWGWNPSGYYRCATFTTCNDRHNYLDGDPNVYQKVMSSGASAGAGSGASAVGDPHLQNVFGQRFDLMKEGKHVLIDIPRGVSAENALLHVQADARRLGGHCADMYFQEVNVTGSWAEAKQAGGYHYSVSQNVGETPEWTAFGKVELKVVHGRTKLGLKYLNLYVKHLVRAGFAVGGLLGEDDHGDVSQVPAACHQTMALVSAPRYSDVF